MSFTALRSALRVTRAVAAPVRATAFVAPRLFTTSSRVASDHQEPVIQGEGGKAGLVPTDLEQATGLERFELMMKLKGEDAFSVEPLEVIRMGTVADPIEVFSLVRPLRSPALGRCMHTGRLGARS
jgi:cytochrome c oxidase subunit 5b